jgi:hypothetical protein
MVSDIYSCNPSAHLSFRENFLTARIRISINLAQAVGMDNRSRLSSIAIGG